MAAQVDKVEEGDWHLRPRRSSVMALAAVMAVMVALAAKAVQVPVELQSE